MLSLDVFKISDATMRDVDISKLVVALKEGRRLSAKDTWNIDPGEFSIKNGILVRNHRVVVPRELCERILIKLHLGHFGILKIKSLARNYCWWPNVD